MEDFQKGQAVSRRYRNPSNWRIPLGTGFGRGSLDRGSEDLPGHAAERLPGPIFESDEHRTWFLVRLPVA